MRRLLIQLLILYTLCLSSIGFANNLIADYLPEQCHYKGGFEQQQIRVTLPVPLISKGTFYSSCENGIVWQTNQPHVSKEALILTRSDTHFRALQNDLDSLEQIESIGINSFASILIAIMQKDDAYLEQTFALDADLQSSTLKLTPLSAFMKKGISVITIEKQATAPIVNITKSNGDTIRIKLHDITFLANDDSSTSCQESIANIAFCDALYNPSDVVDRLTTASN